MIIDPKGVFLGDRICRCSDVAQLHWMRLYAASNNYARLELSYEKIKATAYRSFKQPPSEVEFWAIIKEFKDNFLLFVYQAPDGSLWGQWQTNDRYLLGIKNAEDRRSPSPDPDAQRVYRQQYIESKRPKAFTNERLADLLGVAPSSETCSDLHEVPGLTVAGVGVGVGKNIYVAGTSAPSEILPADQPLNLTAEPESISTKKQPPIKTAWVEEIFEAYPLHEDPDAAHKAIHRAIRKLAADGHAGERYTPEEAYHALLSATRAYAKSPRVHRHRERGEPHFIGKPASWFSRGGYKSDPESWK